MEFKGKKISVIGLARSGLSSLDALKGLGGAVFGSDAGKTDPAVVAELERKGIAFETGGHTDRIFDADLLLISPGVPMDSFAVAGARKRKITVIGEMELAFHLTKADIVAVTGSNGKSTTVTLVYELLKQGDAPCLLGGNIGTALTGMSASLGKGGVLVAEVSSFQLDSIAEFRPCAAAVLNLTPNHLDRYPSEDDYYLSKLGITRNQTADDALVLNADDPNTLRLRKKITVRAREYRFSAAGEPEQGAFVRAGKILFRDGTRESAVLPVAELALPGRHNLYNALAAVALAGVRGIPAERMQGVLRTFKGIEHRIEFVRELAGVSYFNDSKATTVDSLKVALLSMKGPAVLIAGGRDKKADFSVVRDLVGKRARMVITLGEASDKIEKAWAGAVAIRRAPSMEAAIALAAREARAGDSVLLSPACTSYDMYGNFEERGRHFKKIVEAL